MTPATAQATLLQSQWLSTRMSKNIPHTHQRHLHLVLWGCSAFYIQKESRILKWQLAHLCYNSNTILYRKRRCESIILL